MSRVLSSLLVCASFVVALCAPAAGVENVSIPSADGKLQLPGYWFETAAAGARPAVISLHGCGGLLDDHERLSRSRFRVAEFLDVEGMHMLALDSFTPRGLKSICETPSSQRVIQPEDRRGDVFAAIQWLARRPNVDKDRIAVVGYSHGGSTVLSVLDRTEKVVRTQPVQPRAAVAFYPGCSRFADMFRYEISVPLLLMIGESDNWTPASHCVRLRDRIAKDQKDASFELILYPESHHGFDAYGPPKTRTGLPTKSGWATVGGNTEAREKALRRMFEFLSAQFGIPLLLSHDERFAGHRYVVPPASGFAKIEDVVAVPVGDKGHERYKQYLGRGIPKAFAIGEKGTFYVSSDDVNAMWTVTDTCAKKQVKCWLYAVDDTVVWRADRRDRIDVSRLQPKPRPTPTSARQP